MQFSNKKAILVGKYVETFDYESLYTFGFKLKKSYEEPQPKTEEEKQLLKDDYLKLSAYRATTKVKLLIKGNMHLYPHVSIKFLTLTFDPKIVGEMTNLKKANKLFSNFMKRFDRRVGHKIRYVAVPEYQDDFYYNTDIRKPNGGLIHYHILLFNVDYIDVTSLAKKTWKMGGIDIQMCYKAKGLYNYITKYIAKSFTDIRYKGQKRFFYSLEEHIEIYRDIYNTVKIHKSLSPNDLVYSTEYDIKDRSGNVVNHVKKNEYMIGQGLVGFSRSVAGKPPSHPDLPNVI